MNSPKKTRASLARAASYLPPFCTQQSDLWLSSYLVTAHAGSPRAVQTHIKHTCMSKTTTFQVVALKSYRHAHVCCIRAHVYNTLKLIQEDSSMAECWLCCPTALFCSPTYSSAACTDGSAAALVVPHWLTVWRLARTSSLKRESCCSSSDRC